MDDDAGPVPVVRDDLQMSSDRTAQPDRCPVGRGGSGRRRKQEIVDALFDDLREKLLLAADVGLETARQQSHPLGDVANGGGVVSAFHKQSQRLTADVRCTIAGHGWPPLRWCAVGAVETCTADGAPTATACVASQATAASRPVAAVDTELTGRPRRLACVKRPLPKLYRGSCCRGGSVEPAGRGWSVVAPGFSNAALERGSSLPGRPASTSTAARGRAGLGAGDRGPGAAVLPAPAARPAPAGARRGGPTGRCCWSDTTATICATGPGGPQDEQLLWSPADLRHTGLDVEQP